VTFTCNPVWLEITRELSPAQQAADRPDLIARVFHLKLRQLKTELFSVGIFGLPIGWMYTIKFQKRGLPHAHILIILSRDNTPRTVPYINEISCAEIPDPTIDPLLYLVVVSNIIHRKCSDDNPSAVCM